VDASVYVFIVSSCDNWWGWCICICIWNYVSMYRWVAWSAMLMQHSFIANLWHSAQAD